MYWYMREQLRGTASSKFDSSNSTTATICLSLTQAGSALAKPHMI